MPPLKQRIVEVVRRAGAVGISGDDLFAIVYDGRLPRYRGGHAGRAETRARTALKANIYQINQQVTGYRIVGSHCVGGWYRLIADERVFPIRSPCGLEEDGAANCMEARYVPKNARARAGDAGSAQTSKPTTTERVVPDRRDR